MAGIDNLRAPTAEEARERGRKGGLASVQARKRKKEIQEAMQTLLAMPLKGGEAVDIENVESIEALKGRNITTLEAACMIQIQKALKGDTQAFTVIRDSAGMKPVERVEVSRSTDDSIREMEEYLNEREARKNTESTV